MTHECSLSKQQCSHKSFGIDLSQRFTKFFSRIYVFIMTDNQKTCFAFFFFSSRPARCPAHLAGSPIANSKGAWLKWFSHADSSENVGGRGLPTSGFLVVGEEINIVLHFTLNIFSSKMESEIGDMILRKIREIREEVESEIGDMILRKIREIREEGTSEIIVISNDEEEKQESEIIVISDDEEEIIVISDDEEEIDWSEFGNQPI